MCCCLRMKVKADRVLYAHTSRIEHHETNPGCARELLQQHGDKNAVGEPASITAKYRRDGLGVCSLSTCTRIRRIKARKIPAYDMIKLP